LGIIEGISDGLSSFAKLGGAFYADGLPRRKPIALIGYQFEDGSGATLCLTNPGSSVAVRDKNNAVEYLG
jgi:hypothetical protein